MALKFKKGDAVRIKWQPVGKGIRTLLRENLEKEGVINHVDKSSSVTEFVYMVKIEGATRELWVRENEIELLDQQPEQVDPATKDYSGHSRSGSSVLRRYPCSFAGRWERRTS